MESMSEILSTIRIGILEDHTVIREMLASFLSEVAGFRILFSTGDIEEAWSACCRNAPEVIIVDLELGSASGFGFIERLKSDLSPSRCLVFTANNSPADVKRAMRLNAAGYLQKSASTDTFLHALRTVAAGGMHYPVEVLDRVTV